MTMLQLVKLLLFLSETAQFTSHQERLVLSFLVSGCLDYEILMQLAFHEALLGIKNIFVNMNSYNETITIHFTLNRRSMPIKSFDLRV